MALRREIKFHCVCQIVARALQHNCCRTLTSVDARLIESRSNSLSLNRLSYSAGFTSWRESNCRPYLRTRSIAARKEALIMNFNSNAFQPSTLMSNRSVRSFGGNYSRTIFRQICTIGQVFARRLERAVSGDSEKFYQEHVTAIFMAIYAEVAFGLLIAAVAISIFRHWAM